MSSIFVEILKLSFCLTLNCSNKIFLNTKFTLFSFLYVFDFISCHHAKRKPFFLGQHILSKEILKRISFNDLTLLHDVDLKRSLFIFGTVSILSWISHLKMKILFKFFARSKYEIKYAWMSSVYDLKWSVL